MNLNQTHDPTLRSWVASANDPATDFPIQNLPFGRFRRTGSRQPWRIGVAIGDQILDLKLAMELGAWNADVSDLLAPLAQGDLNTFMAQPGNLRSALRAALSQALSSGSAQQATLNSALLAQADGEMSVPCSIGDYTDFYTGIHHATAVGKLFRPENPLLANYKWVPIGYHGRSSSIGVSEQIFKRPHGQTQGEGGKPNFGPAKRLDYELEMGIFVGPGNGLGEPVDIPRPVCHEPTNR